MRRSSRFVLAFALLLVVGLWVLLGTSKNRGPDKMDQQSADAFLQSGRRMLEAGDSDGIMNLFAPDSKILGTDPDSIRSALVTAIEEMHGRPLTAVIRNLSVTQQPGTSFVTFDIDIDERQKGAAIHYFTSHVNLTLKKMETAHWLGIYRTTDWKITQMDADPPFGYTEI